MLVQISFSSTLLNESWSSIYFIIPLAFSVVIIIIAVIVLKQKSKTNNKKGPNSTNSLSPMNIYEVNEALENSRKHFHDRMKNIGEDPDFTATLTLPSYDGLCVPGYKNAIYTVDFFESSKIAEGGFGAVYLGTIFKLEIAKNYNEGETKCIIKAPTRDMPQHDFLQELSVHEVFRSNKYFSRLVCYSENPQRIVLKYYKYGSLKYFIRPEGVLLSENLTKIRYTLNVAIALAKRIAWALSYMHKKGYIHNDVKPDNILLDSDEVEPLFPVISDFGSVEVTNSAEVVQGMDFSVCQGISLQYASPERLKSFVVKKKIKATAEGDVYSVGIILFELVSRKKPWGKEFDINEVIEGKRPNLSWTFDSNSAFEIKLKSLLKNCWSPNPCARPAMEQVYIHLTGIWD
jgi:serine/threonine protein kinase